MTFAGLAQPSPVCPFSPEEGMQASELMIPNKSCPGLYDSMTAERLEING